MDGQEVEVVVETCEGGTYGVLCEVRSCGSQEMGSALHFRCEGILVESHSESSHLSCSHAGVDHHGSPPVHLRFPVVKSSWDDLRDIVSNFGGSFSDSPEEPPFSIVLRREF